MCNDFIMNLNEMIPNLTSYQRPVCCILMIIQYFIMYIYI